MAQTLYPTRLPVHLGSLSGSGGNAFAIWASVKSSAKQLYRATGDAAWSPDHLPSLFDFDSYEAILTWIEENCDDLDGSIDNLRNREDDDE